LRDAHNALRAAYEDLLYDDAAVGTDSARAALFQRFADAYRELGLMPEAETWKTLASAPPASAGNRLHPNPSN
jgi:hypothetical protein